MSANNTLLYGNSPLAYFQLQYLSQNHGGSGDDVKKEHEPMTLRISGQLLYGVVKIYSRKTRYLFEEVSLALIRLKSAFAITKSITVPIEQTIISSLDSITLKDTVTEANVLYDAETFDIGKVFGLTGTSGRTTQSWENSNGDEPVEDDFSMGDVSVGRNNGHDSDVTGNGTGTNIFVPNFEQESVAADNDVGNDSIDALARRAQIPVDDLEGADEFELPLDLDLKQPQETEAAEVAGISDFQLSAVDNMDLEFTVDDSNNDFGDPRIRNDTVENIITHNYANELEENDESSEDEDVDSAVTKKRGRNAKKKIYNYKITDVVRTQRKRLVVDINYEISTDKLKRNQREYPGQLRKLQVHDPKNMEIEKVSESVVQELQPPFLITIGSSWKSIKRRRLLSNANIDGEYVDDELPQHMEVDDDLAQNLEQQLPHNDDVPEFSVFEESTGTNIEAPKIDDLPDFESNEVQQTNSEEELVEEQEVLEARDDEEDFDAYLDSQVKSKSTIEVAQVLRNKFEVDKDSAFQFDNIVEACKLSENKKSSATRAFFELLVLGSGNAVKLEQNRLFGEITVEAKQGLYEKFL
ncbi:hypothetical protein PMKS-000684 [Pichia membranifaciens]|uniref:Rad21/Rec8-like protein N-terminal domain-containing protein n=1 Tax=Pichia membranifaciens TaxID=4926 RepID=A0A1Q2YCF6_9ASCO|nr:hypothetical protein PMKS-000684 [Pichia membranifaciens]